MLTPGPRSWLGTLGLWGDRRRCGGTLWWFCVDIEAFGMCCAEGRGRSCEKTMLKKGSLQNWLFIDRLLKMSKIEAI